MVNLAIRTIAGRRSKYLVLVLWLLVVILVVPLAGKLSGAERNETKAWLPANAESTKVIDLESAFQSPNLLPAVVVYDRSGGLTAADEAKIAADSRRLGSVAHTDGPVSSPVVSADGQAAEVMVPIDLGANGWKLAGAVVAKIASITQGQPGLTVHVTGPAGFAAASSNVFKGIDTTLLYGTMLVVIVILLLTYRSPMLWLLPISSAGIALITAEAVIYEAARHGLTVNALSVGILTVLVFGAGTDYALLLVARYREELRRNEDRHQAMQVALRRASPAILASASTVILGLLCLTFAETSSTSGLGPVAAIGVAVALATMLTLLPALLVTVGRWIFWPVHPRFGSSEPTATGPWARMGGRIARRPRHVWIATALGLGVLAVGVSNFHADGLTNSQSYRGRPDAVVGQDALAAHFPGGLGSPVVVIANAGSATQVERALASTPGIAAVTPAINGGGKVYLQGTLSSPPDSQAAYVVIDQLRTEVHAIAHADAKVGGATAVNLDVERAAARDRNLIIPIVLLVVFAILVLLLRAIVAPVMLIGTVVLSLLAALGLSAEVFTHVFGFAGADAALPLYAFVFLVALGIDYNIFLMSRVREESKRQGTHLGALSGLAATGGVITSAGCVLAGTFAMMGTLPLTTFTEIGFIVAFGVLLDTIIVRSVLVTALNLELGEHLWWPSRLWQGPNNVPDAIAEEHHPADPADLLSASSATAGKPVASRRDGG
jgi:putative drug exporter of the RND superfamily